MHLERQREEVCANLPKVVDGKSVIAAVVEVLDVALLSRLVDGDHLAAVPSALIGGHADCVDREGAGQGGALVGRVELGHACVQPFQGVEGGVVRLLEEHMTWTTEN